MDFELDVEILRAYERRVVACSGLPARSEDRRAAVAALDGRIEEVNAIPA